jgi:hypothetical protein
VAAVLPWCGVTPLERAALDAEQEAESLRAAAGHAMTLEGQSGLLYDVATDAIEAYERARDRACEARKLADHYLGAYNAWSTVGGGDAA